MAAVQLPLTESDSSGSSKLSLKRNAKLIVAALATVLVVITTLVLVKNADKTETYKPVCPIVDYYRPSTYDLYNDTVLKKIIHDDEYRNQSIAKLAGAVRIPTETHDEDPLVDEDPDYWMKFDKFEKYLKETFPVFYAAVSLEKINSHGLIYTWVGSNSTLKPLVLMLHQDVVPAPDDTLAGWKYPPFEGHYDGSHLWGRGVADCKNLLIGLLESAEELINNGFEPHRTVIYSFGFDEEVGGRRNQNADRLMELYGPDSMYAVVDEGGISLTQLGGQWMAMPGTGEKGSIDIKIQLTTPGGHSSVPPDHTSIGMVSDLILEIENSPFELIFTDANPTFRQYRCMAEHSTDIDADFKADIINAGEDAEANKRVRDYIDQDRWLKYYIKTSQAVDVIRGGAKSNALPESVQVTINHRVAIEQSVWDVVDKDLKNSETIAKRYNLGLIHQFANGTEVEVLPPTPNGYFTFSHNEGLEPAPVTPINDAHWAIFGGNIRHVYEEISQAGKYTDSPIIVSPGIATGNTDTKLYWGLTDHIYRYRPGVTPTIETNAHGVNENIDFDSHLQIIAFYFQYIQSVDELEE